MKNLGGDEQVVRWQRSPIDQIREFLARVVRLGLPVALHGSLLLPIVTMVLVEERNVIQCVKIYEELCYVKVLCVVACTSCELPAPPGCVVRPVLYYILLHLLGPPSTPPLPGSTRST
jgi:hypothetical protein